MFSWGRNKPSDAGDWSIQSARDLLEEMRDKMYAQCGDSDPNPQKVELCGSINNLVLAMDEFQMRDCGGNPIGPKQHVQKTVVLSKVISKICNVEELATAIGNVLTTGAAALYNTVDCIVVTPGASVTIAANTLHSLSFKMINGNGTLQIGNGNIIPIISGEADGWEATTTIAQAFTFTATSGSIKINITKQ